MTSSHTSAHGAFPAVFMAALLLAVALNPVNSTLISTALEPIATDFGVQSGSTQILVVSLYLACTVGQPTAGKLSELFGPRRILLAGCAFVLAGGLMGACSTGLAMLIAARVLIGIGTSCGYPAAMHLVSLRAEQAGLAAAPKGVLSALAIVGLALMAVGPPLGGMLVSFFGWRSTFFVDVPLAVATCILTLCGVSPDHRGEHKASAERLSARLDISGIIGFACFMILLLIFLLLLPDIRWIELGTSLALAAGFVIWERRAKFPFLDVRELASNHPLVLTYFRAMFTMLGAYVVLYAMPQWLEAAHGCDAFQAGLTVVPMGILATAVSLWSSHHGTVRTLFIVAGIGMLAGGVSLAWANDTSLVPVVCIASTALGITLGANITGGQFALFAQARPAHIGVASGLLRTFTYLGSIGASVISGMLFQQTANDVGMHAIGLVVVVLGIVVVAITIGDRSLRA